MNSQIETLKQELREFIKLSETITPGKWFTQFVDIPDIDKWPERVYASTASELSTVCTFEDHSDYNRFSNANATFIARSRNISPTMAESLLVAVEGFENVADNHPSGECVALQQILNIWEASK